MPSGGDSGGNWIFLSIKNVLRHVNMFLFLNQNLGVVYLSVCMYMLSTCSSCIDASLLLSISIENSIVSTVSKVKYSVSHQTENTWYRPPLPSTILGYGLLVIYLSDLLGSIRNWASQKLNWILIPSAANLVMKDLCLNLTYKQSFKRNACGFTSCAFGSWILIPSAMNSVMKELICQRG